LYIIRESLDAARILKERTDLVAVLFKELDYDDNWALLESLRILEEVAEEYEKSGKKSTNKMISSDILLKSK
jgi:hypothetical protein